MIDAANIPAEVRPLWLLLSQQFESGFELWKYDHAWDRIVPECTVGKRTIFEEAGFSRSLLDSIHDSDAPSIHALA
jgi:hypothetical protein